MRARGATAPGRARWPAAALAVLAAALACRGGWGPIQAPEGGSVTVEPEVALAFQARADAFYARLVQRRFNTLETFNDATLRAHFLSEELFFDYYADLAESLAEANFEKNRPITIAVEEFLFEDPERARVLVRFVGGDDRPLRPDRTTLLRMDRWERSDGEWWVIPGKL